MASIVAFLKAKCVSSHFSQCCETSKDDQCGCSLEWLRWRCDLRMHLSLHYFIVQGYFVQNFEILA